MGFLSFLSGGNGGSSPPPPVEVKETEQEKALAGVAASQWGRYQTVLAPFENKFLSHLQTTQGQIGKVVGDTATANGKQYDDAREGVESSLFKGGVNPNSGKFMGASGAVTAARGATSGMATTKAGLAADDLTRQNMDNAVKMGRGQAVDATAGMSSLAGNAVAEANNAARLTNFKNLGAYNADTQFNGAVKSTLATAAGMGLGAWQGVGESNPDSVWYRPKRGEMYDTNTQVKL